MCLQNGRLVLLENCSRISSRLMAVLLPYIMPMYYTSVTCFICSAQVTGNTVFNMIRLNEILTDKDDRPIGEPPKIIKAEV